MGKVVATIPTPDWDSLGPAMRQLTEKQQRFVIAMVETGGGQTNAAAAAGYSPTGNLQAVIGHQNMRNDKIIAAIREEADKRLRAGSLLAASVMVEIASNPTHKDQLKAAIELANRGGLAYIQKVEVAHTIEDRREKREMVQYLKQLAVSQGLDPRKLLGCDLDTIDDAEFEEVTSNNET